MKNGVLDVAVLFLIILSITGVTSANPGILADNTDMKVPVITMPVGGWADLDIIATAPGFAMPGDMSISVLDTAGDPAKGLQVSVNHKNIPRRPGEALSANLKVKDISGDAKKYIIKIGDPASGVQLARAIVEVKPRVTVPEFPTVALSVAVIMGLVFFLHRRQRKG